MFLAVVLLSFASFGRADSLRLLAPADGVTLRGGSFAELRWSANELPASAEEWEAFLSIDGGKYYAFRVTPHLSIDRQRFTFIVPNVDTHEARILIRTGDEVHEAHFENRGSFSIERDSSAEQIIPRSLQFGRAEAARDGDPAVLWWVDGARNGSGVTQQSSAPVQSRSLTSIAIAQTDAPPVVLAPSGDFIGESSITSAEQQAPRRPDSRTTPLPRSVDLLLVCSRRNI
jgi:hypothetical protein